MIDGVKIVYKGLPNATSLPFRSEVLHDTGEMVNGTRYAVVDGLRFEVKKSKVTTNGERYTLNGSIAKFYNDGLNNAFDYTLINYRDTLIKLEQKHGYNPHNCLLQGFEFGFNLLTDRPVKKILNSLISYKQNTFGDLKIEGKSVGIHCPKQQYTIKLYDKGKQATGNTSTLLRIELSVNKMEYIKHLNIQTLADLNNVAIWHRLTNMILDTVEACVWIDPKANYKAMTPPERLKYLRYLDPKYWDGLEKKQAYKAKQRLSQIMQKYSLEMTPILLRKWIQTKAIELTAVPPKYGDLLTNLQTPKMQFDSRTKRRPFNTLDKGLISPFSNLKNKDKTALCSNMKNEQNKTAKTATKTCPICERDFERLRSSKKYCSKRCNNKQITIKRKADRQATKAKEIQQLPQTARLLNKSRDVWLHIHYTDGVSYAETLHQTEINVQGLWIRKVTKVEILIDPIRIFTSHRAKQIINQFTSK